MGVRDLTAVAEVGWDIYKQQKWLSDAKKENPIRLQHYTTEKGKNGIEGSGCIDPAYSRKGSNFFTPNIYFSTQDATERLALPNECEFYISLNMFKTADNLAPITIVGERYGHKGGGLETSTSEKIYINGLIRMRSQWIPLTQ